jgi:hypothetical protein
MDRVQYADPLGDPNRFRSDEFGARRLLRDRRNYSGWFQQGLLGGGTQFKLIYTGSTNGVWMGVGPLIFTPGDWNFTVTQTAWIMMKGCGPGGQGGLEPNPLSTICGGGGGGAYTLGSGFSFNPGKTYSVSVTNAGTQAVTFVVQHGVEWMLHMGGGTNGRAWNVAGFPSGAPGGVVGAGIAGQSNGGNGGRWNPTIYPANMSGPAGGGFGGNGNLGGTGGMGASAGGSGESGAGAPNAPHGGFNGGCGGYGAGLVVAGYPYGRGGGGAGEVADGVGGGNSSVYVLAATSGVVQFTKA